MTEQEYDKEQLRIMRNAFKAFDHDEKGVIEHSDVHTILELLGQKLDDKAIKNLIKEVDKGTSGKLDFSQFCRLASRFVEVEEDTTNLASELKEAFRVYDKEGKGYLTVQTLRDILHELDDKLSSNDLDMIIEEIDADGSGTVDFDEFMQVMTGKNFYDFTVNRRFVFEPSPPPPSRCQCPSHRNRLHRRIEWHFERFFEQMLRPFDFPIPKRSHVYSCSTTTISPPCPAPPAVETSKSYSSTTKVTKTNAPSYSRRCEACRTTTTTVTKADPRPVPPAIETSYSSATKVTKTSAPVTSRKCEACRSANTTTVARNLYRPIFRPRLPEWVPIFTLYREIVQNPFRRRARYMITHI